MTVPVDPATQIDDFFDYSKVVVKKPWGYEYLLYQNGVVAVWILYIKPGFQTSMHCHPNKKTSLVLLSGEARCLNLHQETKLLPGDGLLIEKGVFHCTASLSEQGIFVMEIESPINKRDLIRLKDSYGRVGQGYETVDHMSYNLQNYNYVHLIEPQVFYNVKKKFGQCSIALAAFTDYADFTKNFLAEGWGAVSILKGKILDGANTVVLDVGDTIDAGQIVTQENLMMEGPLEIITIQKRDRISKLSDYVISFLEQHRLSSTFVVPGSANVHLLDSLGRNTNLNHITTQTEQAATQAAEAYAKLTGKTAVAIIAAGCAGPNSLTGVASAWVDSTPLLVISGQSQSNQTREGSALRQLGVQEVDIITMVKPITKYAVRVTDPLTIRYHLEQALFLAQEGRQGPVWIDLPIDIQGMNIDEEELVPFAASAATAASASTPTPTAIATLTFTSTPALVPLVQKTYHFLRQAQRPVLLAGNGIRLSKAELELRELIGKLQIPILLSKRGADLLPEHDQQGHQQCPYYFGRPGAYGHRSANFIIQNADLLLSIGCRLSIPLLGRNYRTFARAATKIVVDVDPAELQKNTIVPDLGVACSAKDFIQEMLKQFPAGELPDYHSWRERCQYWKEKYQFEPVKNSAEDDANNSGNNANSIKKINAYTVIRLLSQALPEDSIITIDGGSPNIFMMQQFQFKVGQRLISSTGLENISFGLPAAIGAAVASNKPVLCICEDRGFQKNVQELETIMNYNLPIKILILNQGGYSYVQKTQKEYFGRRFVASQTGAAGAAGTDLGFPDLQGIATAYHLPYLKMEQNSQLEAGLKLFLQQPGAMIGEVVIDPQQEIVPRIVFKVRPDGKWLAKPLEDMYPFLDRKEFKENMIVEPLAEEEL